MRSYIKCLTLFIVTTMSLSAQKHGQALIDSLTSTLSNISDDKEKVELLNDIATEYYMINPDKGIKFGKKSLKLAENINWDAGKAIASNVIGINYHVKGDYSKALEFYYKSLDISRKLKDTSKIASTLSNIGIIFMNQSNYPKALEFYHKALKYNEILNNEPSVAAILSNIGVIYLEDGDYEEALRYLDSSLKIDRKLENKHGIATTLGNIGNIYNNRSEYQKSLEYYNKALKINEQTGNKSGIAHNLSNIGNIYKNMADFAQALNYFKRAYELNKSLDEKNLMGYNLGNIGEVYLLVSTNSKLADIAGKHSEFSASKITNINKSLEYSFSAVELHKEIGSLYPLIEWYKNIEQACLEKGNHKAAYEFLSLHKETQDSVFNMEKSKEIGRLEAKYEIEKKIREQELKEKEEARLREEKINHRNMIQYSSVSILVVILLIAMMIIPRMPISFWWIEGFVFITFLLIYEFLLVVTEPWVDGLTGGIPIFKLGINIAIALLFLPFHRVEDKMREKFEIKAKSKNT